MASESLARRGTRPSASLSLVKSELAFAASLSRKSTSLRAFQGFYSSSTLRFSHTSETKAVFWAVFRRPR